MNISMKSTRSESVYSIDEAIQLGLAPDGGLFIPESFPKLSIDEFYSLDTLGSFAYKLLAPFFTKSLIPLDEAICSEIFSFPIPLHNLSEDSYILELFHGPTLSFKDFGARFFAHCLASLRKGEKTIVLVATSGDTGSAVASAFNEYTDIDTVILFPKNKISVRQQAQITIWGSHVHPFAVRGSFDQCQTMVKKAFSHSELSNYLTTANSINIARLLPQILFYAFSSIHKTRTQNNKVNFIVPSGNLGNVTACYWARELGFPIDEILIANNANRVLLDYINTGIYEPRPSIKTLANAMDVGNPSNLERLVSLYPDFKTFKEHIQVESVSDQQIQEAIVDCYFRYNYILCPHTATAYHSLQQSDPEKTWILAATAHPAKFAELIEPLLHCTIPIPDSLATMLEKHQHYRVMEPSHEALFHILSEL